MDGLYFTQPYSGGGSFAEVDIVIAYPGGIGRVVQPADEVGATKFSHKLDMSAGQLTPNSRVTAHFEAILADGLVAVGPDVSVTYKDDRFGWKTKSGKIVRLHWYEGNDAFAGSALSIAEQGIQTASAFLGTPETEPIDFFIYATTQDFYDAMGPGMRQNVGGLAISETRTLFGLIAPGELDFVKATLTHELTHVVYDDAVSNAYHSPPHWLNEGIAQYVAEGYSRYNRNLVTDAGDTGTLMPLESIRGMFPTTADRFYLAYAEAASAVDYLIETHGKDKLIMLIQAFRTGASDDEAFRAAIGLDSAAFDRAWLAANGISEFRAFGPQPAPTGPLPPGWSESGSSGSQTPAATQAGGSPSAEPTTPSSGSDGRVGGVPPLVLLVGVILLAGAGVSATAVMVQRRGRSRTP
jgi:hypothetical protein